MNCINYNVCKMVVDKPDDTTCEWCSERFGAGFKLQMKDTPNECPVCLNFGDGLVCLRGCSHYICRECFHRCNYGDWGEFVITRPASDDIASMLCWFSSIVVRHDNEASLRACPMCREPMQI